MKIVAIQTDETIRAEIGSRIESARLNANLTQTELAATAGVSRATVERVESGDSVQLTSLIRLLRALGAVDGMNLLLPEPGPSPMALLRAESRKRRRASGKRAAKTPTDVNWTWGDGK